MHGESNEKWLLFTLQMSPRMKYQIEDKAHKLRLSQSELVRQSVDEFLQSHAETEAEQETAELISRQRKERLGLMKPKDGFRTEMQIMGAWDTIEKAKAGYIRMGVLGRHHYNLWIRRLRENIESLDDDNPTREAAEITFNDLIVKLTAERNESFPEGD